MTYDPRTYWPNRYAVQGVTYVARGGDPDSYEEQRRRIAPLVATLPTPGRVLDFGCGPERFRDACESHGLIYDGFDIIPGLGTVDTIEPRDYDCALAIYVFQHIVDAGEYAEALATLYDALKPSGMLLVVDHEPMTAPAAHMKPRGPEEFVRLFGNGEWWPMGDGHWTGRFTR